MNVDKPAADENLNEQSDAKYEITDCFTTEITNPTHKSAQKQINWLRPIAGLVVLLAVIGLIIWLIFFR